MKQFFTKLIRAIRPNFMKTICEIKDHDWEYTDDRCKRHCTRCPRREWLVYQKFGNIRYSWKNMTIEDVL